jgi:hypothetical protein
MPEINTNTSADIITNTNTDDNEVFICDNCGETLPMSRYYGRVADGDIVCEHCFNEYYRYCDGCQRHVHREDYNHDEERCYRCIENSENQFKVRGYSGDKYQSWKAGKTIKSLRRFGIEIEIFAEKQKAIEIAKKLPDDWGIGSDSSINPKDYEKVGIEIRSPILQGEAGEKIIESVCRTLRQNGAEINHTCGFHVHLSAGDLNNQYRLLKKSIIAHLVFNDVITAMLPKYRRKNTFAKSLSIDYGLSDILKVGNYEQIRSFWYKGNVSDIHYHSSRYYGFNYHNLLKDSRKTDTIEIRYHSPTLSATKINNWIALHQTILDKIIDKKEIEIAKSAGLIFFEDKLDAFKSFLSDDKLFDYVLGRIKLLNPSNNLIADKKQKQTCAV